MEHIIDFEQKQRSLIDCMDQFHRSTPTDNTSRRQWFDSIVRYVKEGGFDQGATSYMINYAKVKGEILSNSDKVEAIYKSIERVMNAFHQYVKIDIKKSPFAISLVADAIISQEELTWLIDTYDGIVHRFRANARLVEKFMNDVSGDKFLDDDYQVRILRHIEPYEDYISDIYREYATPQVLPMKTTPQEKKARPKKEKKKKEWQLSEEHKKKIYQWLHNKASHIVTKRLVKVFNFMGDNEIEIPSFNMFNSMFPNVIKRSQYYKAKAQYDGKKLTHIDSRKVLN